MKIEGQKVLKASPYHPNRFKRKATILVEIVIHINKNYEMRLYYITKKVLLQLDEKDNLMFKDVKAGIMFIENTNCKEINIYDRYSIESLQLDYTHREYRAVEKNLIYANGKIIPVVKFYRKVTDTNWLGYDYHSIIRKES